MINEGLHERLAEIYDEFDRHSRITNTRYSIDTDECDLQGYRVLECGDFKGFLRHMSNFVKNKWVDMKVDGAQVDYNDLNNPDFNVAKSSEPIFQFTLSAIREDDMLGESQFKGPTNAHTRKQSQHRSSFRENEPGIGQYKGKSGKKKKRKKKVVKDSFERKLNSALTETVNVQFTEPQVLFTRDEQLSDESPTSNLCLAAARNTLSGVLDQYHYALKHANDDIADHITNMIENCTSQINDIDNILNAPEGEQ